MDVLKEWFHIPKLLPSLSYKIDEVIDISLKQVKKLHPDFDPIVTRNVSDDLDIIELPRFSDIFFIIFENIQRHSGVGDNPSVTIQASLTDSRLQMTITNEMRESEEIEARLKKLRAVIDAGQYQKVVRSEGGTGLVKLWNTIGSDKSILTFEAQGSTFKVFLEVPMIILSGGADE